MENGTAFPRGRRNVPRLVNKFACCAMNVSSINDSVEKESFLLRARVSFS